MPPWPWRWRPGSARTIALATLLLGTTLFTLLELPFLMRIPAVTSNDVNDDAAAPLPVDDPYTVQLGPSKDVLFIKVPKSGGTTLAITLSRYARIMNLRVADPGKHDRVWLVDTCTGSQPSRLQEWKKMVAVNDHGPLQVFASHSCTADFMFDRSWWSQGKRPLALTMIRDPWDTLVSQFRYLRKCCTKHALAPNTAKATWCLKKCHITTLQEYVESCSTLPFKCSQQYFYVAGDRRSSVIDRFNLVLTLERFNEGLALLRVLHNFPFVVLPYMSTNANTAVKQLNITQAFKQRVISNLLRLDYEIYMAAQAKMDRMIGKLTPEQKSVFVSTMGRLNRANAAASKLCSNRRTESCLGSNRTGAFHSGACFADCIEQVAMGETDSSRLPAVPTCSQCSQFKVNCEECICTGDGGARCKEVLVCTNTAKPLCKEETG